MAAKPLRAPFDHEPTREEMVAFLESVPALAELNLAEYVDYCKPIKQSINFGTRDAPDYKDRWQPYFMVDGRLLMCARFHQAQDKAYDRETVEIERTEDQVTMIATVRSPILGLGVGRSVAHLNLDGKSAEATHPEEVAETSALGRALATLGFGILPGAGLASAEDMKQVVQREKAANEPQQGPACPECDEGVLVEKKGTSKAGKPYHFWGCSRYPQCKHTQNDAPRQEESPPDQAADEKASKAEPDEPEGDVPMEDYIRLEIMAAALKEAGVDFAALPAQKELTAEGYQSRVEGMGEAAHSLPQEKERLLRERFESKCKASGITPKFKGLGANSAEDGA